MLLNWNSSVKDGSCVENQMIKNKKFKYNFNSLFFISFYFFFFFSAFFLFLPLTVGIYFLKRSNSWQIWNANSRVWHKINETGLFAAETSICCNVERTKTAVFPIPDFAWHKISVPMIACGIHSCWTFVCWMLKKKFCWKNLKITSKLCVLCVFGYVVAVAEI